MSNSDINIKDRFVGVDFPDLVLEVQKFIEPPGLPPHVGLKCAGHHSRSMMIGKAALLDNRLFRKLS